MFPLVAACLALVITPGFAAGKAAPIVTTVLGNAPAPDATLNGVDCTIGQFGAAAFSIQFILPPNDEFLTLLEPAGCCPGGATALTVAHAILLWPTTCQLPVNVSILGATSPANCLVPDRQNVICQPTRYILDGSAGGVIQHDFPMPGGFCIQGPAFLVIEFVDIGSCPANGNGLDAPRLVSDDRPDLCTSYNYYRGDPKFSDVIPVYQFPGNPLMWAEGHCCGATPMLPSTWGSVKSLYR